MTPKLLTLALLHILSFSAREPASPERHQFIDTQTPDVSEGLEDAFCMLVA